MEGITLKAPAEDNNLVGADYLSFVYDVRDTIKIDRFQLANHLFAIETVSEEVFCGGIKHLSADPLSQITGEECINVFQKQMKSMFQINVICDASFSTNGYCSFKSERMTHNASTHQLLNGDCLEIKMRGHNFLYGESNALAERFDQICKDKAGLLLENSPKLPSYSDTDYFYDKAVSIRSSMPDCACKKLLLLSNHFHWLFNVLAPTHNTIYPVIADLVLSDTSSSMERVRSYNRKDSRCPEIEKIIFFDLHNDIRNEKLECLAVNEKMAEIESLILSNSQDLRLMCGHFDSLLSLLRPLDVEQLAENITKSDLCAQSIRDKDIILLGFFIIL